MLRELIRRDIRDLKEWWPFFAVLVATAVFTTVPLYIGMSILREHLIIGSVLTIVAATVFAVGFVTMNRVTKAMGCCVDERIRASGTEEERKQLSELTAKLKGRYERDEDRFDDRMARRKLRVRFMRRNPK